MIKFIVYSTVDGRKIRWGAVVSEAEVASQTNTPAEGVVAIPDDVDADDVASINLEDQSLVMVA